jgi:hydrogenase/urease accessory protein HupE
VLEAHLRERTARRVRARALATAMVIGLAASGGAASAHQQTVSFGILTYPTDGTGGANVSWVVRIRAIDVAAYADRDVPNHAATPRPSSLRSGAALTQAGAQADRRHTLADVLRGGLTVAAISRDGAQIACPSVAAELELEPADDASERVWRFTDRFACAADARALRLRYTLFFDRVPLHESFTRLALGDDERAGDAENGETAVFRREVQEVTADVHRRPSLLAIAGLYLRLGVAHILTGYDHLAFLLALLLAATYPAPDDHGPAGRSPTGAAVRRTVAIASAFTVAHSVTLALQALHPVPIASRWVESIIALSVAYVGFENVFARRPPRRAAVVFGFGLVHGLGFASVLREIGLPHRGLVLALVSFNLGVELGQLLVIALLLPALLTAARRWPQPFERWGLRGGSAVIGAFGALWVITRIAGH